MAEPPPKHASMAESAVTGLERVAEIVGSAIVNDVPVLFAHTDGPVSGGVLFRVGWADEPLARAGITHLVEHLALFGQSSSPVHHNGSTDAVATHFHATGTEDEVVGFLNRVSESLSDLPLERMAVEKEILRTEAARRAYPTRTRLMVERYGARGPGLLGFEGFGLNAVETGDVRRWVAEKFTRGNAVVWITTGALPPGLDLRLPEGARVGAPEWPELPTTRPAWFVGPQGIVLVDAVVPRSMAGVVFARVASRMLFRRLREEGGLSYTAVCEYALLDEKTASVTVLADALPEKQVAVMSGVMDVLIALREGQVDDRDVSEAQHSLVRSWNVPAAGAALLPSAALNLLLASEIVGPEELVREVEEVEVADVVQVANQVWTDALAQIPEGDLDTVGFAPLPVWSSSAVTGRPHPRIGEKHGMLVIADEGITAHEQAGVVTILYDACLALEQWPDGARRLTGDDGFRITVEPTLHANIDSDVVAAIDAAIPASRYVVRLAREPETIPRPRHVPQSTPIPAETDHVGYFWLFIPGILLGAVGLVGSAAAVTDMIAKGVTPLGLLGFVFPVGLIAVGSVLHLAYRRRGRHR